MQIWFEKDGNAVVTSCVNDEINPSRFWENCGACLRACDYPVDIGKARESRLIWGSEHVPKKGLKGNELHFCAGSEE